MWLCAHIKPLLWTWLILYIGGLSSKITLDVLTGVVFRLHVDRWAFELSLAGVAKRSPTGLKWVTRWSNSGVSAHLNSAQTRSREFALNFIWAFSLSQRKPHCEWKSDICSRRNGKTMSMSTKWSFSACATFVALEGAPHPTIQPPPFVILMGALPNRGPYDAYRLQGHTPLVYAS